MKINIRTVLIVIAICSFIIKTHAMPFKVTGTIAGVGCSKGLFIIHNPKENGGMKRIEFDIVDGKFEIADDVDQAYSCSMSLGLSKLYKYILPHAFTVPKSSIAYLFVYPNANVTINGEALDYLNAFPKDGKENDLLAKLNREQYPLLNRHINIKVELNNSESLDEAKRKELEDEQLRCKEQIDVIQQDFLKKHLVSYAGLFLLEDLLNTSRISEEEASQHIKKVPSKYRSTIFYQSITSKIEASIATSIGQKAPNISSTTDANGRPFDLKSMYGKLILIDFWGPWCGPCMKEIPKIKEFRNKHLQKMELLGIGSDKNIDIWKQTVISQEMNWPNIFNGKGDKDYVTRFNIRAFPTKILLSPSGEILLRSDKTENFFDEAEKLLNQ